MDNENSNFPGRLRIQLNQHWTRAFGLLPSLRTLLVAPPGEVYRVVIEKINWQNQLFLKHRDKYEREYKFYRYFTITKQYQYGGNRKSISQLGAIQYRRTDIKVPDGFGRYQYIIALLCEFNSLVASTLRCLPFWSRFDSCACINVTSLQYVPSPFYPSTSTTATSMQKLIHPIQQ